MDYEYNYRFNVSEEPGPRRFIRVGMDKVAGAVVRCMVGYEVEIGAEVYQIVRYDTGDDGFHRHVPGFPEASDEREYLPHVPLAQAVHRATQEILENYRQWETRVLDSSVLGSPEGTES